MDFTNFKNYMDILIDKYKVPGLDCIVYKDHELVFRYFTGMSDREAGKPMKGDELYLIFSMTKMLTCTAALQLLEKGCYVMSDPISKWLPEFEKMKITTDEMDGSEGQKVSSGAGMGEASESNVSGYAQTPITVKHLFTMSAGLNYALADDAIKTALNAGKKTTRELVGAMANKTLSFEPGTRFQYSLCHDVLGALIEIWSGKKLGEYMKENIFEPLGMKNTFFGLTKDEDKLSRMMARYCYNDKGEVERVPLECVFNLTDEYESGGAGLTSCPEDYAIFLDAIACGGTAKNGYKLLSSATVELMGTNHLTGRQCEDFYKLRPGYGYGLGVRTHTDKTVSGSLSPVGEFGWDGAAGSFAMVDTKNKLSITYFQHVHRWDVRIQTEMRNALYSGLDVE